MEIRISIYLKRGKIMKQIIYTGAFIDVHKLQIAVNSIGYRLERPIANPHVTFQFRPKTVPAPLFGENVCVKVVGYGNDGKNEGVKVELCEASPMLLEMAEAIPVPHITVSVSAEGKPVDTSKLDFHSIEPFFLDMTFGAFTTEGVILANE